MKKTYLVACIFIIIDYVSKILVSTFIPLNKSVSLLGKPEEDIKGDTNSIIYFKNKDNKKYYFEFEFFNQSLCALHVGLSN